MHWSHRANGAAWAMAGWLLGGCGPLVLPEGETETEGNTDEGGTTTTPPPPVGTTTPPGTTSPPPPPLTTTTPSDESTSDETMTSLPFLPGIDSGPIGIECDPWEQDCPRGEKCMPWANDGGSSWNALRCTPIAEDPGAPGEPCMVEGSGVSGIDTCELGAMCWDVDPETLEGHCVAFCVGSPDVPTCEDPNATCAIGSDGVLALCFPQCDPLLQACPEGQVCTWSYDSFLCIPDASGDMGAVGDPCEFVNVCDPGSFCAPAELVPECQGAFGCCSSFCDLGVEPPPCLPGQECVPWYEDGEAPAGGEDVGACAVPR